jgi:sporulation protein YlmC with PRC-barrel domain
MFLKQLSKSLIITLTVPALMLASTAFAMEREGNPATSTQTSQQKQQETQPRPTTDILKLSKVIGVKVENAKGDNLGEINDVVIDPIDGRITYAVLEAGGFLGLGEKYFAIPWRAFQTVADENDRGDIDKLILNVDKDRMKKAPGFDKDHWPNMADPQWGQTMHTYYGQGDYWKQRQARRDHGTMQEQPGVSATVQQVRGNTVELQVPQNMVQELQAGDRVEVSVQKQTEHSTTQPSQSNDQKGSQEHDMGSKSKN